MEPTATCALRGRSVRSTTHGMLYGSRLVAVTTTPESAMFIVAHRSVYENGANTRDVRVNQAMIHFRTAKQSPNFEHVEAEA